MTTHSSALARYGALALALTLALWLVPAIALTLQEARSRGLVGETPRGYIAPVGSPTPDVSALVNQVNAARRGHYADIAGRTGAALEQVEILTAREIRQQVPDGTYLLNPDGSWVRK
jgi:uncharacterized protein